MKKTLNLLTATITLCLSLTMLSACSKGGGDNAPAASPPAPGPAVTSSGTAGYVGNGTWNGSMHVQNIPVYKQFLSSNNLCWGWQCERVLGIFQLQISTVYVSGGYLPAQVVFVLSPFFAGYLVQGQSQNAVGYINGTGPNTGLLLNYNGDNFASGCGDPTFGACNIAQSNQVMLQISTQYTDATHNTMNVQVLYYGQKIADGTMQGDSGYNNGNQNFTGLTLPSQYPPTFFQLYSQPRR